MNSRKIQMIFRHSPKKDSRSVTSESLDLAQKIFEGKRELTTLDSSEVKICLQGMTAIRHRSMIENNKRKMQKCDSLISELKVIGKSLTQDSIIKKSSSNSSINFNTSENISSSNSSVFSNNQIEITDDEMNQIDSIITSLLNGSEIDYIDSSSIPKLEAVLKMRKDRAIDESDYQSAKIFEKNIQLLSKFRQKTKTKVMSPSKQRELIAILEARLENLNENLQKLENSFIEERERIKTDYEESLNSLFAQHEKEVNEILEVKSDIMMGVGFKPSKQLKELRQQEKNLAKLSLFDEASEIKKKADDREMQERREFDRKNSINVDIKERDQRKKQNTKIQTTQEYWNNLLEKTENKYESEIRFTQNEIDKVKAKIEEVSGKKYVEKSCDTNSEFSDLSFTYDNACQPNNSINEISESHNNTDGFKNENENNKNNSDDEFFNNNVKSDDEND